MKMEIFGPLILSLIAGLSTVIGALLIFIKFKKIDNFIVFCLSFSIGIMFFVSIFDLLPESFNTLIDKYKGFGIIISILVFLLGFLSVSKINNALEKGSNKNNSLYKIGILSMISLMLHNFPEGIAVFVSAYTDISLGLKICIAIMLHNIPEGIAIAVPMYYSGASKKKSIIYTLISGLSEPLGAIITFIFLRNYISKLMLSYVLMFVAGLMVSLSIDDMLKEVLKYKKYKIMIISILLSLIIFLLSIAL